jgi:hypothetical protein
MRHGRWQFNMVGAGRRGIALVRTNGLVSAPSRPMTHDGRDSREKTPFYKDKTIACLSRPYDKD